MDEAQFLDYLAKEGRLTSPDNVPPPYRRELMRLMAGFVDSELAGAAGFAPMINRAPSLDGRRLMARLVLEKLGYAERVLALMEPFGTDPGRYVTLHAWEVRGERERDLGQKRQPGDMRLNVFHYPFAGWVDALVMNLLMGQASVIQLEELARASYQPLAEAAATIARGEEAHMLEGMRLLAPLVGSERQAIDDSLDYWRPRVADSFGADESPRLEPMRRFGLRRRANAELRAEWDEAWRLRLAALGL